MNPVRLKIKFHPVAEYRKGRTTLSILGLPIYRDRLDNDAISGEILQYGIVKSFIAKLDGSFLIIFYNEENGLLSVANDRFASIPFYYYFDGKNFIGSLNYSEIWSALDKLNKLAINKEAFYEFIHLQRLLGDKTYDKRSKYLNSATVLSLDNKENTLKTDKYWHPDFSKSRKSPAELSHIFAALMRNSVSIRTSDARRYGLLLSGGLDSRLVLAGLQKPIECVTVGERKNNEYRVAKELAALKNYPHSFIERSGMHYVDILEKAVFLGSAMNVYDHAHFLNLGDKLRMKADVFLHGHGLDYMFQGKYLPVKQFKIFGKNTYMKRMKNVDRQNIKDNFLSGVSYRLKSIEPLSLVIDAKKNFIREYMYSSLEEILREGDSFCGNAYDLWEYLIVHNLSRHYTFLNIASIRTFAEERTPAFDNRLFDFYLSLPAASRLQKRVFTDAIRILDKRLYSVRNANTSCNVHDSDFTLTAKLLMGKILSRFGLKAFVPPKRNERSWPVRTDIIRKERMRKIAGYLADSETLRMLDFLDMDKIRICAEADFEGKADHSDLILTLITIDAFLKMGQRDGAV